jgi:hypothetical protein
MKKGAFALIDCLGFKGIWRDEQDALMVKLRIPHQVGHPI